MTAWRDKRTLAEMIVGLRAQGYSWRSIGRAIGISHERARQVWQLSTFSGCTPAQAQR